MKKKVEVVDTISPIRRTYHDLKQGETGYGTIYVTGKVTTPTVIIEVNSDGYGTDHGFTLLDAVYNGQWHTRQFNKAMPVRTLVRHANKFAEEISQR